MPVTLSLYRNCRTYASQARLRARGETNEALRAFDTALAAEWDAMAERSFKLVRDQYQTQQKIQAGYRKTHVILAKLHALGAV